MKTVDPGPDFSSWRKLARLLLNQNVPPEEILWEADGGLFHSLDEEKTAVVSEIKVPSDFIPLAQNVACNSEPVRWALLYRILWRLTRGGEKHLLEIASDPDIVKAQTLAKNVRREIHKMHAFVRFKLISTDEATARERYAAWFEPEHFVVAAATPFFRERFSNMDWSIFTPKGSAHWIGETFTLGPGVARNPIEDPDALEAAWSVYYRSIFNPARLKVKMMQTEMPKKYWKNLPEAREISGLISASRSRVGNMLANESRPAKPAPKLPYLNQLQELSAVKPITVPPPPDTPLPKLRDLAANCRACPLWENATCTVFGEGPENSRVMIVGEQPGDREDVAGRPFVGPAGKLLDRALEEAGIDRHSVYLTNAVKHFKWKPRGKLRLHQSPNVGEIDACRPWLLGELKNVRPDILIILGATAARSVFGKPVAVTKSRGLVDAGDLAERVILTVHPSYLLRRRDPETDDEEYAKFVADLRLGAKG